MNPAMPETIIAQPAPQPASVSGTVTNSVTGEPILRAHVTLHCDAGDPQGGAQKTYGALSNAKGAFGRIRKKQEVRAFFDGLDLVEPGLVDITDWRPDGQDDEQSRRWGYFGGVGRKPA